MLFLPLLQAKADAAAAQIDRAAMDAAKQAGLEVSMLLHRAALLPRNHVRQPFGALLRIALLLQAR